jgi:hypothetical protein
VEFPKSEIIKWSKKVLPVLIGATGGYAYYYFIGCASGACPISSNPYISTAYGGLIGLLMIPRSAKQNNSKEENL